MNWTSEMPNADSEKEFGGRAYAGGGRLQCGDEE